jgi:hypothetical protein
MLLIAEHPRNFGRDYGFYIIDDNVDDEIDFCSSYSSPSNDRDDIGIIAYEAYNPYAHVPNQAPMLLGFIDDFYGDVIFAPTGKGRNEEEYAIKNLCNRLHVPYKRLPRLSLEDVGDISQKTR